MLIPSAVSCHHSSAVKIKQQSQNEIMTCVKLFDFKEFRQITEIGKHWVWESKKSPNIQSNRKLFECKTDEEIHK